MPLTRDDLICQICGNVNWLKTNSKKLFDSYVDEYICVSCRHAGVKWEMSWSYVTSKDTIPPGNLHEVSDSPTG